MASRVQKERDAIMKALVLSGGGCKGAYQVGALKCLLGEARIQYDILCGVSVGALNAAFVAQFPLGSEQAASNGLVELWAGLDTSKIYKKWFPLAEAMAICKPSVYDSSPLQELVRSRLDVEKVRSSGRSLRVGAVSLMSGEYRLFGEDYADVAGAVLASSAFPAMLTPIELEGELWTDGGVRDVTPLKAAIDLGADEVDIIMCAPEANPVRFPIEATSLKIAQRCIDIMADEITANDIQIAQQVNALVESGSCSDKRLIKMRIIRPSEVLIDNSLDFEPSKLIAMISKGYEDACKLFGPDTFYT